MKKSVQLAIIAIAMTAATSCNREKTQDCECHYDDYTKSEIVEVSPSCTNHNFEYPDKYDSCSQVF